MQALIGVIGVAIIGLMVLMPLQTQERTAHRKTVEALTAGTFRTLLNGAQAWVQAHRNELTSELPVSFSAREVSLATLVRERDIPGGLSPVNAWGQTWHIWVQQPAQGDIEAFVTTSGGKKRLEPSELVNVVSAAGVEAGFIPYDGMLGKLDSRTAEGAGGAWSLPVKEVPNPGPGQFIGRATLVSGSLDSHVRTPDNLYRDAVVNHPELNRMNTGIDMGGNDVSNARDIHSAGTVSAKANVATPWIQLTNERGLAHAGAPCSLGIRYPGGEAGNSSAVLAASDDGSGTVLSCMSGHWQKLGSGFNRVVFYDAFNPAGAWTNTTGSPVAMTINGEYYEGKRGNPDWKVFLNGTPVCHLASNTTANYVSADLGCSVMIPAGWSITFGGPGLPRYMWGLAVGN